MIITSIHTSVRADGHYETVIYFVDSTGINSVSRIDLNLQGVEEFIRDFRIKHHL